MKSDVNIFDIHFPRNNFSDVQNWVKETLAGDKQSVVAKVNSEFLLRSQRSHEFKEFLRNADLIVPDGIGVLWAAKFLSIPSNLSATNHQLLRSAEAVWQMIYSGVTLVLHRNYTKDILPERLSGVEVFKTMLLACSESGKSVYFFGAKQNVLDKAITNLKTEFPKLNIAGSHDGYSDKGEAVIADINKSHAELLIVALGSPEQEYWIRDNLSKLPRVLVAVGEGGSLDYVAGANMRAPRFFQHSGLEWLWRGFFAKNLTTGAGHRMRRVWNAVPVFIYEVVKWKVRHGSVSADGSK